MTIEENISRMLRLGSKKYIDKEYFRSRKNRHSKNTRRTKGVIEVEEYIVQLRQLRLSAKLSQQSMANKLKTKQSVISRFENGLSNPTIGFLKKFANQIHVSLTINVIANQDKS